MLGDVLLIGANHEQAARAILERLPDPLPARLVVAVGGESGSGKSELAHVTSRLLKERGTLAKVLHTDNYYRVPPAERTAHRQAAGFESIGTDEYDWPLLEQHLDDFRHGRRATLPCIDILTDQVDALETDFGPIPVLLLEGLYAVKAPADVRVFIDLTYHQTKKAQALRGKEPQNEFRRHVLEAEHRAVRSLRPLAHWLVDERYQVIAAAEGSS
ncbi:MAG: uridine kinase [Deltaproteobacteria bacterium]|jgi:uridine kinase|nr:uridine kinase [Deltaproteobacteria bacterium]MBW2534794.1 uridine kinase [Deltaproteobacteria bacterium]